MIQSAALGPVNSRHRICIPNGLLLMLQGEADDEGAVAAAQEEAGAGAEREVALLHSRLRLLAAHALVSAAPHPPCCALGPLLSCCL